MRLKTLVTAALFLASGAIPVLAQPAGPVDLSGAWRFQMDPTDAGVTGNWFHNSLTGNIKLPGILQAQGFGDPISVDTPWVAALPRDMRWYLLPQYAPYTKPGNIKMPYLSQPPRHYLGVAWYQRDIDIPADWADKTIHLTLERPHWETTAWIDDKKIGDSNSLVAPHEFEAVNIAPGRHTLSIRIDNRMSVVPGYRADGHSVSDALGATWNGIAGKIELSATSPVFISDAQVFPNLAQKSAFIKVTIGNGTGKPGAGTLACGPANVPVKWDASGGSAQIEVTLGDDAQIWDEFHPVLQKLTLTLNGDAANDSRAVSFGLREVSHNGKQLLLNNREINLRMTHWGGDFALTGYPATDVASWKKIIQTCKDFGLNGFRFHSWCPPEAAFQAADELGFYIDPECGMWNSFNPNMLRMLETETERIEHAYGNHPSFILLSPSNEPSGDMNSLETTWAATWIQRDPRRLYSGGTGRNGTAAGATYASAAAARGPGGWFGQDYASSTARSNIPVLGHEVGQWCAYPDFDVIKKFTGYLQPGNYEIWRDFANEHGVLAQNHELAHSSGEFQVQCYKQEVEANLRTPGISGIQLLDLHDYLGQGGALVGVLDAFWQSKGYVTAEEFHRFCAPVVPLARMQYYVYRTNDTFDVPVEIANYSQGPIPGAAPYWKITDMTGKAVAQGDLPKLDIPIGKNISLGRIAADISKLAAPGEFKLVVGLTGSNPTIENDWNFWLYAPDVQSTLPADVLLTGDWAAAKARLADGGKVIYCPPANMLDPASSAMTKQPIFWNRIMNNTNGTATGGFLGLLVNDKSPALAEFPTQDFCDFQWTDIVSGVRSINVEDAPPRLIPIVQAIDDWNRGCKLGVIFECTVGKGKLLVSAINLQADPQYSAARQLRKSIFDYAASDKFNPAVNLTVDQANALWPSTRPPGFPNPAMPTVTTIPNYNPGDLVEPAGARQDRDSASANVAVMA